MLDTNDDDLFIEKLLLNLSALFLLFSQIKYTTITLAILFQHFDICFRDGDKNKKTLREIPLHTPDILP